MAGDDYNSKHTVWTSRLNSPKGHQLKLAIDSMHLNLFSTGEPTYWPTHTYLAQTPEIGQGLGRFLSCGARKQEQT